MFEVNQIIKLNRDIHPECCNNDLKKDGLFTIVRVLNKRKHRYMVSGSFLHTAIIKPKDATVIA